MNTQNIIILFFLLLSIMYFKMIKDNNTIDSGIEYKNITDDNLKSKENKKIYNSLRPLSFDDFIGQDETKNILKAEIEYCKRKSIPLRHILLYGQAGLGKTTLAQVIANESNRKLVIITGNVVKDDEDVISLFNKLQQTEKENPILFIDEIHLIKNQEAFYTILTDNFITLSQNYCEKYGVQENILQVKPITVIGATTHSGLLLEAMRSRFNLKLQLKNYSTQELSIIVKNTAKKINYNIDDDTALFIAENAQTRARRANDIIISAQRFTFDDCITIDVVKKLFELENIYNDGLYDVQVDALEILSKTKNHKLGAKAIANSVGIEAKSWSEEFEPYLLYKKYIAITTGGREITQKGLNYIQEVKI